MIIKTNRNKEYNLSEYVPKTEKIAISIIAFNRPKYLQKLIKSLTKNKEFYQYPVYLFQDCSNTKKENLEIFKKYCPHGTAIVRTNHYGCGLNIIDSKIQLLDNLKYDYIFTFEDDLIVYDRYIEYCLKLKQWTEDNNIPAAIVHGWNKCTINIDEKIKKLNDVKFTKTHLWGILSGRTEWDSYKEVLYEFRDKYLRYVKYKKRDAQTIKTWLNSIQNTRKIGTSGQDGATFAAIYKHGYQVVGPLVNRAVYIGTTGMNFRKHKWYGRGFQHVNLDHIDHLNKEELNFRFIHDINYDKLID